MKNLFPEPVLKLRMGSKDVNDLHVLLTSIDTLSSSPVGGVSPGSSQVTLKERSSGVIFRFLTFPGAAGIWLGMLSVHSLLCARRKESFCHHKVQIAS